MAGFVWVMQYIEVSARSDELSWGKYFTIQLTIWPNLTSPHMVTPSFHHRNLLRCLSSLLKNYSWVVLKEYGVMVTKPLLPVPLRCLICLIWCQIYRSWRIYLFVPHTFHSGIQSWCFDYLFSFWFELCNLQSTINLGSRLTTRIFTSISVIRM